MKDNIRVNGWDFEYVSQDDGNDQFYQCRGEVMYDDEHDQIPEPSLWRAALKLEQILTNAGEDIKKIRDKICSCADAPHNFGYDVKNKVFGDMYNMGVIDPAKVTKNALKNAVSVATTILSTNAIVTMKRK